MFFCLRWLCRFRSSVTSTWNHELFYHQNIFCWGPEISENEELFVLLGNLSRICITVSYFLTSLELFGNGDLPASLRCNFSSVIFMAETLWQWNSIPLNRTNNIIIVVIIVITFIFFYFVMSLRIKRSFFDQIWNHQRTTSCQINLVTVLFLIDWYPKLVILV